MTTIWGPGATEYRFYWHQELHSFANPPHAAGFVGAQKENPGFESGLNNLMDPLGAGSDADQLTQSVADSLMSGELVAGGSGLDPAWRCGGDFRDRSFGLRFLGQFRHDPIALARLRGLLYQHKLGADFSPFSADEVFEAIAALLSAGRLIPGERLRARAGLNNKDEQAAPSVAASSASAPAPAPASAEEEEAAPTFENNDGAAQAAALRAAAAAGTPFCEECAKG
jgi:hypothetical protein